MQSQLGFHPRRAGERLRAVKVTVGGETHLQGGGGRDGDQTFGLCLLAEEELYV